MNRGYFLKLFLDLPSLLRFTLTEEVYSLSVHKVGLGAILTHQSTVEMVPEAGSYQCSPLPRPPLFGYVPSKATIAKRSQHSGDTTQGCQP